MAETKVTRIKASDTPSKKKEVKPASKATNKSTKGKKTPERKQRKIFAPFRALGAYFKGAWFELRQVRWPTRKATWSLTGAVLLFTLLLGVLIILLDLLFKYLFELIIT